MPETHVFSIPMRTRFRGITVREGMLLRGDAGWGEFSPFLEYDDVVAAPWLAAALEAAEVGWPEPLRDRVPVNVTVPAVGPETAHATVLRGGCRTAKVKVAEPGQTLADDEARLEAVRDALGPDGRVRVDANGGWTVDEAVTAIGRLDRAAGGLEYVEQPCADRRGPRRGPAPRRRADRRRRVDPPGRGPLPGPRPRGRRRRRAQGAAARRGAGLPADRRGHRAAGRGVSSALETSVGIAAGVALAAALPELPHACGLATVQLLTGDVVADPLLPVDGVAAGRTPRRRPGPAGRARARPTTGWRTGRRGWPAIRQDHRDRRPCPPTPRPRSPRPWSTSWSAAGCATSCCARARARRRWPSRRTPADAEGRLTLHIRIDERTAAFLALGLARTSRTPGRGGHHERHGGRQPAPGGARGLPLRGPAGRADRRPAGVPARHRREPDHRAGRALRRRGTPRRRRACAGAGSPGGRAGARLALAGRARRCSPRPAAASAPAARCTSTSSSTARSPPTSPTAGPTAGDGRPDGAPWTAAERDRPASDAGRPDRRPPHGRRRR